jgi:hypothetical protein
MKNRILSHMKYIMSSYRIITDYYSCTCKNNKKVRDLTLLAGVIFLT